jgi:hypothetical protein
MLYHSDHVLRKISEVVSFDLKGLTTPGSLVPPLSPQGDVHAHQQAQYKMRDARLSVVGKERRKYRLPIISDFRK